MTVGYPFYPALFVSANTDTPSQQKIQVIFPSAGVDSESGTVTGSGNLAPGIGATVLIEFTPDSLGEYHDVLSVVTEAGTFEVI